VVWALPVRLGSLTEQAAAERVEQRLADGDFDDELCKDDPEAAQHVRARQDAQEEPEAQEEQETASPPRSPR
jgi:hypothetical protein